MITTEQQVNITPQIKDLLTGTGQAVNQLGYNLTVFDDQGSVLLHFDAGQIQTLPETLFAQIKDLFGCGSKDIVSQIASMHTIYPVNLDLPLAGQAIAVLQTEGNDTPQAVAAKVMLESSAKMIAAFSQSDKQIEQVSNELSNSYEELVLLYKMSSNMKVTHADSNYLQLACDSLTEIIDVEGIAILLKKRIKNHKKFILTAGAGIIDINPQLTEDLQSNLSNELFNGAEALLDSDVDSPHKYDWPDRIRNIIAVPLQVSDEMTGMLVAINRKDKPDFDSTDVKLFNSVAHQCAVFIENGRLFNDLKELLVGSLRALTSSIDAKDQYTRGHSERVAFIARWIAENLAETEDISREMIHRIYLAGLLHDIGKIGIDETVLGKNGKLTDTERKQIMSHPSIGAAILSEIKQMNDIVPGVLNHHERVDGKGYPYGLKGDQINLIGKIVSIADAFDAMTSKRTYRDAMSLEDAAGEIRKGLGTQFDEKVGQAFLNSDLHSLSTILQEGENGVWAKSDFVRYSSQAVGTLIK